MTVTYRRLLCAASAAAILTAAGAVRAEVREYDIPSQALSEALARFGAQSDVTVVTTSEITGAKSSRAFIGKAEPEVALAQLLTGTGLSWRREGETFLIVKADGPQAAGAAGGGAEVEVLIVTAQKREEDIQDVPIAISAFTPKDLEEQKIEGGFDLLKAIPASFEAVPRDLQGRAALLGLCGNVSASRRRCTATRDVAVHEGEKFRLLWCLI